MGHGISIWWKFYTAIQKKKLELSTSTWIDVKNILYSEKSKSQSYMYSMTIYVGKTQKNQYSIYSMV